MPFSPQSIEAKPYNMCIDCQHIGKRCDGPNFLAMNTERWCEWCKLRKEFLGWTNAHVAEVAEVAKVSVDRVMSGNVKDLRISTMQAITRALVNGSWGQYPCAMAETTENPALVAECGNLRAEIKRQAAQIEEMHKEEQERERRYDEQLREKDKVIAERGAFMRRKDRYIAIFFILAIVAWFLIFAALAIDKANSDIGFFWLEDTLSAVFGNHTGGSLAPSLWFKL